MCPSSVAVYVSLNRIISVYFVNLSTMTKIKSYFSFVTISVNVSNFVIKSIMMSYYSDSSSSCV